MIASSPTVWVLAILLKLLLAFLLGSNCTITLPIPAIPSTGITLPSLPAFPPSFGFDVDFPPLPPIPAIPSTGITLPSLPAFPPSFNLDVPFPPIPPIPALPIPSISLPSLPAFPPSFTIPCPLDG